MPKVAPRLYNNFRPEHYQINLDIDPDKMVFSGQVVITGKKIGPPAKRLVLHSKDLKVSSARITKLGKADEELKLARINIHKSYDELRLHTEDSLRGGLYRIEVEFSGKITDAMHGIYPCYFDQRKQKLIGTQFESHHAREAFPCIDEPEAKATFELSLVTPKTTVISNMPVKAQSVQGKHQVTSFETTPRMSSYLLAFVIGDVVYKSAKTKNGVEVRTYGTPVNKNLLGFALDTAIRCVDFFEDYFGVAYPMSKLDLIGLPDFSSGAMENWGLITFRESIFFIDPKTTGIETKQYTALVINHELAHQWFGNLVTMKWWDDLWLNESFANLMEYVATDALFPEWRIWEHFVNQELSPALKRDALPNVQSIRTKVNHPDELATLFDPAIVYAKGGSVLNMLRHHLGEDVFRRGLKLYFDKHAYSNTEADDLWDALGQASGQDVKAFMDKWLTRSGYPVVDIDLKDTGLSLKQSRLLIGKAPKQPSDWPVPLRPSDDAKLEMFDKSKASYNAKLDKAVLFNDQGRSYFIPRYINPEHWDRVVESVKSGKVNPTNRNLLLMGQVLLEKALLIKNSENLDLLEAYQGENEESVWGGISAIIGEAKRLIIGDEVFEAKVNRLIRNMTEVKVKELGWDAKPREAAQTQRLRNTILSLAAAAEDPDVIKEANSRFDKFTKPADLAPDIRDVVYYVAARFGGQKEFDKLLKLYKQLENADERNEIAGALTSTRDPKQARTLINGMTGSSVRLQDVAMWYIWLLRNHYSRQAAWEWMTNNWQWIEEKFGSDKTYDNFPTYSAAVFSRQPELHQYEEFFKPKMKIIALGRAIKLGLEEIEARVAWREANEQSTKNWLNNNY
jgi:aminopeptidase N